jgi:hypothetical protein
MLGKHRVLISVISAAVIAVFVFLAMLEWFSQRGAAVVKDVRGDKAPDFILADIHQSEEILSSHCGQMIIMMTQSPKKVALARRGVGS